VRRCFCLLAAGFSLLLGIAGCNVGTSRTAGIIGLGRSDRGKELIRAYGCGECHVVPGVKGARGRVGPPLTGFGNRSIVAGELANTPENLTRWICDPEAVLPDTSMPDLGVTEKDANDIAAYLYELRDGNGSPWID